MACVFVFVRPQPLKRWHSQIQSSIRPECGTYRPQKTEMILNVFEDVKQPGSRQRPRPKAGSLDSR